MTSCRKQRSLKQKKRKQYQETRKSIHNDSSQEIEEEISQENKQSNSLEKFYKDKPVYDKPVRRGEMYFFDKGPIVGVEQNGGRPGIIVSNNKCNKTSEFVEVVYTTCQEKTLLPTHVQINSTHKQCIALCEQVHTLSKKKIQNFYHELTPEEIIEVNKALKINLDLKDTYTNEDKDKDEYIKSLQDTIKTLLEQNSNNENKKTDDSTLCMGLKIQLDFLTRMYNSLLDKVINKENKND